MLTQLVRQLLAGGAGASPGDHGPGRELEQPFHQGMAAVDQQHVVLGQARQALLHQGTHVVDAAHLLGQQNQGRRSVVPLEGLHLHRHLVAVKHLLKQAAQLLAGVLALGVSDLRFFVLEAVIEFAIDPLEGELLVARFQPGNELGIDQGVGQQHFGALAFP